MKTLKWIAYLTAGVGLMLVIMGSVSAVFHLHMFQVNYIASYFEAASSFFMLTVVILLYIQFCTNKQY